MSGARKRNASSSDSSSIDQPNVAKKPCIDLAIPDVELEALSDGRLKVHLNSEFQDVLNQVGDDDPAFLIAWDIDNLSNLVERINAAPPTGELFGINAFPVSVNQFRNALVQEIIRISGRGGGNIADQLIAPNTISQYAKLVTAASHLGLNAYFMKLNAAVALNVPIGRVYIMADEVDQMIAVADPVLPPPNGVHLFQ